MTGTMESSPDATADTGWSSRWRLGFWIVVAGALALRVVNVLVLRPTSSDPNTSDFFLRGDAFYYHWQADALGAGHFFVHPIPWEQFGGIEPGAAHPPLYSAYLGVWSALGLGSVTAHRLASSLLGVATVALVALLVRRLAGDFAGIAAGLLAALYPQLWINDGMLLSETIAQLTTVVALWAAYWFWSKPTLRRGALFGAALGLAALSRSELALAFPMVLVPLALLAQRDRSWKPRLQTAGVACIVGGLLMAPWMVFNLTRFEEPTLLTSTQWTVISAGSCDKGWYGENIGYWNDCFRGPFPKDADESERDVLAKKFAQDYIGDQIGRIPLVVGARVARVWSAFKPGQTTFLDWWLEGRGKTESWAGLIMFYALIPFAIAGLVVFRRRRIPVLPIVALFVIASLAAAITFGVTRYRAPAEIGLVMLAAVGIDAAWLQLRRSRADLVPETPS